MWICISLSTFFIQLRPGSGFRRAGKRWPSIKDKKCSHERMSAGSPPSISPEGTRTHPKYSCLASKLKMVWITLAIFFLLQKPKGTAKSLQAVSSHFLLLSTKTIRAVIPSFVKRLLRNEDSPFGAAVTDKSLHLPSLPRLHKAA